MIATKTGCEVNLTKVVRSDVWAYPHEVKDMAPKANIIGFPCRDSYRIAKLESEFEHSSIDELFCATNIATRLARTTPHGMMKIEITCHDVNFGQGIEYTGKVTYRIMAVRVVVYIQHANESDGSREFNTKDISVRDNIGPNRNPMRHQSFGDEDAHTRGWRSTKAHEVAVGNGILVGNTNGVCLLCGSGSLSNELDEAPIGLLNEDEVSVAIGLEKHNHVLRRLLDVTRIKFKVR